MEGEKGSTTRMVREGKVDKLMGGGRESQVEQRIGRFLSEALSCR